jgi:hypothetical protein
MRAVCVPREVASEARLLGVVGVEDFDRTHVAPWAIADARGRSTRTRRWYQTRAYRRVGLEPPGGGSADDPEERYGIEA